MYIIRTQSNIIDTKQKMLSIQYVVMLTICKIFSLENIYVLPPKVIFHISFSTYHSMGNTEDTNMHKYLHTKPTSDIQEASNSLRAGKGIVLATQLPLKQLSISLKEASSHRVWSIQQGSSEAEDPGLGSRASCTSFLWKDGRIREERQGGHIQVPVGAQLPASGPLVSSSRLTPSGPASPTQSHKPDLNSGFKGKRVIFQAILPPCF